MIIFLDFFDIMTKIQEELPISTVDVRPLATQPTFSIRETEVGLAE